MVMVYEDGLLVFEQRVAHRAGVLLDLQKPVKLLLSQAVAS
jgi:hypothetical protein